MTTRGIGAADVQLVRGLQERAARAVPATEQEVRDGCWLRYVDSAATWWTGAALLHGHQAASDLAHAVELSERFYAARGAAPLFQVCPACPSGLHAELSRRGYAWSDPVSLLVADSVTVARSAAAPAMCVGVTETLTRRWFDLLVTAQGIDIDTATEWRLLRRVALPSAYATVSEAGGAVAVGRAVVETGWAGIFTMTTVPDARRRGAGAGVLAALAEWALANDAGRLYLQVTHDSTAALRLYDRAGFEQACTYHYRSSG